MKKLSDYNKLNGLRVAGKIARILTPLSKDREFTKKVAECFRQVDRNDTTDDNMKAVGLKIMLSLADVLFNEAPEELLQIIGAVDGKEGDEAYEGDIFDAVNDAYEILGDEKLVNFFLRFFSSGGKRPQFTSTTTGGKTESAEGTGSTEPSDTSKPEEPSTESGNSETATTP